MLRIGMIGAGWVSRHHLIGWRGARSRAKVVAIADPVLSRAVDRAREFGIAETYPDAAALVANGHVDALDVATPRGAHVEPVLLAAERGVPVLCQKPMAPTLADGRLTATGSENREMQFDLAACYQDTYGAAIGHFIDSLQSGAPFETDASDNLETLRLVKRVYALNGR